jgi:rhodanese-related sulfurtransferase/glyoxylase-like metal-dependent hydrolase (beta-lactamase superfamily II)
MKRRKLTGYSMSCLALTALACACVMGAQIKDTESATHGDSASLYQITDTYEYPGFKLIQINLPVLSHYSYMIVSDGKALVVDPGRDIQFYLDTAKAQNLTIMGVFLTHSHADFVAGHMEMVKAVACPIYQSALSKAEYKIEPVTDDTTFQVGQARVVFMDTPGHVMDGTSALFYSAGKADPEFMLSGDYLFVGSVGRPDLVTGTTSAALSNAIFDTWANKVSKLPDVTRVFPAHGAGSLCGAHLRDAPFTTIGEERRSNPFLQYTARSEFVTAVLSELSDPPQYFGHNALMNRQGPTLVDWTAKPETLTPAMSLTEADKTYVVDVRDAADYAAGHIPNSVNIGIRGRFETWTGIMVPWGSNVVLAGEAPDIQEAFHRLHRVGYTGKSVVTSEWQKAGLALNKNILMPPAQLYAAMQAGTEPIIVDVRLPSEWMGLRIGTVLNLPLNKLSDLSGKLSPADPVVAVCNSAYRSTLAIGILERKGFTRVTSLAGGSQAWIDAGYPVYGAETKTTVSTTPRRVIPLPERICASELNRMIMDLPGTFDLVDIRPPAMFADYHLPGSVNVDIADLVGNPVYLTGAGALVIVDRDGSLAMAVAGILSQKTQRQIKAVYGGLEAYWNQATGSGPAPAMTAPAGGGMSLPAPGALPAAPSAPVQPIPSTTKKSAGC